MRTITPLIIAITGPTASGKTDLAIQLAKHFSVELINMDSAQIYRDMNIGTAKITEKEQQQYPHHLMNILTPEQRYSAAQFCRDVSRLVPEIDARGKVPVLVGGTLLYYKALLDGLADLPAADPALRRLLHQEIAEHGYQKLHAELVAIDPELAGKIQGNDTQRLVRFVEIARLTGQAPSRQFRQTTVKSPFQFFHICFFPENRAWLHARIEKRFDQMLEQGLIEEVKQLRETYQLSPELPSMRCAGYRQVWDYLNGQYDDLSADKHNQAQNTPWQEMRNRGIFATRQLAKRQLTWLRKIPADITITDPDHYDEVAIIAGLEKVISNYNNLKANQALK